MQSEKIDKIFEYFCELFGKDPKCELNYENEIQLLVAIVLSAQCTDKRVNIVTEQLFKKYKTAADFAAADIKELEREIYSTGFYRSKAKNIISACRDIVTVHNCKIPAVLETLTQLSGVGRKTASVFLAEFHKIPAMAVDTHVMRVSRRLGFSGGSNPVQIEKDLKAVFDRSNWCKYHLYMVLFGRYYCKSQKPCCDTCKLCMLYCVHRQS